MLNQREEIYIDKSFGGGVGYVWLMVLGCVVGTYYLFVILGKSTLWEDVGSIIISAVLVLVFGFVLVVSFIFLINCRNVIYKIIVCNADIFALTYFNKKLVLSGCEIKSVNTYLAAGIKRVSPLKVNNLNYEILLSEDRVFYLSSEMSRLGELLELLQAETK